MIALCEFSIDFLSFISAYILFSSLSHDAVVLEYILFFVPHICDEIIHMKILRHIYGYTLLKKDARRKVVKFKY